MIPFTSTPVQNTIPFQPEWKGSENQFVDNEILSLIKKGVIIRLIHEQDEFISPIFLREKRDGSFRMILNLKTLNQYVEYNHFKIETVWTAISMMKPMCYMASIDIKDAYYCVPINNKYCNLALNQIFCTYHQNLKGSIHSARQWDFYYAKCQATTRGSRTFGLSYKHCPPILERWYQETIHFVFAPVGTVLLSVGNWYPFSNCDSGYQFSEWALSQQQPILQCNEHCQICAIIGYIPPGRWYIWKPPTSLPTAQRSLYNKTVVASISVYMGCSDCVKVLENATPIRGLAPAWSYLENEHVNSIALWPTLPNHSRTRYRSYASGRPAKPTVFQITKLLKTSRPGKHFNHLVLQAYPADEQLCIFKTIHGYLGKTKPLRGKHTQLLISYQKPHKPVSTNTIARWLKTVLEKAGIDSNIFHAHSTRAASTSAAKTAKLSVSTIMDAAGWTNALTFSKFYDKPVISESNQNSENFGHNLLRSINIA